MKDPARRIIGNILGNKKRPIRKCIGKNKKGSLEIREFEIDKKGYKNYKVIKGEEWASGYDERLMHSELEIHKMKPGKYRVTFVADDPNSGSDAINIKSIKKI